MMFGEPGPGPLDGRRSGKATNVSAGDKGGRVAGGSDAADGGGALSDSSDSEESVSDSSGLTFSSLVVTRRSVQPKCLNCSDSRKTSPSSIFFKDLPSYLRSV